ncbi:hypothetical protein SCHPADRAFT_896422 [Schizopora paradoxa]|uniref:DUF6699 domain-containing protein n=1 Tax=Schizopora paradoxa TaxID=27342 RepID=A0A0H2R0H9_9AGAM|nr:hypothetical protein SCHPADRAFT_896422 [Schizopora paradoxa]
MASRPTTPFIPPNPDRSPAGGARPVIPPPPDNLAVPSWYNGVAGFPPGGGGGGGGRRSRTQSQSGQTPYRQANPLPIFAQDAGGGVSDDWVGFGPGGAPNLGSGFGGGGGPFAGWGAGAAGGGGGGGPWGAGGGGGGGPWGGGGGGGPNFGMAPPGSAFSNPQNLPPGTPWGWPPSALPTGYSAFQQPLPGGGGHPNFGHAPQLNVMTNFPPGYGNPYGGGMGFGGPPSHPGTPWMGGGYVPLTPGESLPPQLPDPVTGVARPKMDVQVDTRWMIGEHYGPVLSTLQATKLGCVPKLNPLLSPPPDDPATRDYLEWNMLFPSAHVRRSSDPPTRSWANGRAAPATFPRVASLKLVSRHLPWILEVRASNPTGGVTCADVIDTLSDFLHEHVPGAAYDSLSPPQKLAVHNAYYHNRSRAVGDEVPGGRLGEGMKRCDWLGRDTMFEGIEPDGNFVRERLGLEFNEREGRRGGGGGRNVTCVFVVRCARRGGVTEDEREANEERGRVGTATSSNGG